MRQYLLFVVSLTASQFNILSQTKGEDPSVILPHANRFFESHCVECHNSDDKKGGFNLGVLDDSMGGIAQTDLWTRVYDRIEKREMPPLGQSLPSIVEIDQALADIRSPLITADRTHREVVQRRLNRIEYQNTINDLLSIQEDLYKLLPEDQRAGGFDNNGEALAVSTEQMLGYLQAARQAIDTAIVTESRPELKTFIVDSIDEVKPYFSQGFYSLVDGRVVIDTSNDESYSKISTRSQPTPTRGLYRFRFKAASHNTSDRLCFAVTASNFVGLDATYQHLGYYEAGPEPKVIELMASLDARSAIQFFPLGLPYWINRQPGLTYPALGFGEVEVTGPIIDQWPPISHSRLIGNVDLQKGTLQDANHILNDFIPRAFRRDVADDEIFPYRKLVKSLIKSGRSFDESIRTGLVSVLCSPNFLYICETPQPQKRRVSDFELASRLAYFLWSTQPNDKLIELARKKELSRPANLRDQVERMLDDPKSNQFVKNFTGQWLKLREINDTTPDKNLYASFDDLLQVSMTWESEGFFREMLASDVSIDDMIDSRWTMMNERLAKHYEIEGVMGLEMRKVALPKNSVRGGVLTQAAVLKVTANGTTTSPVLRGVWVLENILGQSTPPPPPNTAGIEPDIRGTTTVREQLDKHRSVESCSLCHRRIDPPGFALESFDPIGKYRDNYLRWKVTNEEHNWGSIEQASKVDASGTTVDGKQFADIREFKGWMMTHRDEFARCLTEKLMSYGLGREMGFSDRNEIAQIVKQSQAGNNGLRSLLHAIIQSKLFSTY